MLREGVAAMKNDLMLTTAALVTLAVSSQSALSLLVKVVEFFGLVGLLAVKSTGSVCFYSWLMSAVLAVARHALWDSRFLAFVVLHGAMWLAKIFLFAAVFSGQAK
jgi:hypothetical protein